MNITMEWMARLSTASLLGRSPAPKGGDRSKDTGFRTRSLVASGSASLS